MTEQQIVSRARESQMILESEAFKLAMEGLKSAVLQQLDECPIRDHEGRLLLTQLRKLSFKFEGVLIGMIENGKIAQNRIDLDKLRNESAGHRMLRRVTG